MDISNTLRVIAEHKTPTYATVGIAVAAAATGYFVAKRNGKTEHYDPRVDKELAKKYDAYTEALEAYEASSSKTVTEHVDAQEVEAPNVVRIFPDPQEPEVEPDNIFLRDDSGGGWDWKTEIEHRKTLSENDPHVIHQTEYFEDDDLGYDQATLTYYEEDGVLTAEDDSEIPNIHEVTGRDLPFGKGSNDKNAVYIQNNRLGMKFEVLRHSGSYVREVLGHEAELEFEKGDLKHSLDYRFRGD